MFYFTEYKKRKNNNVESHLPEIYISEFILKSLS